MSPSELRLIKRCAEFVPKEEVGDMRPCVRGIYVLLYHDPEEADWFDVVYVGMARGEKTGIKGRLQGHARGKKKRDQWTHFSAYEVWDNIQENEIQELEGLFRHIYRKDPQANALNTQRSFRKLNKVRVKKLDDWPK